MFTQLFLSLLFSFGLLFCSDSNRRSPEPNCSICLGKIEEQSFANKCFHSFCKTCLFEWSKVKAECPVCRQPFNAIIFNVKAMDDYKEFKVMPKNSNRSFLLWNNIEGIQRLIPPPHIPFSNSLRQRFLEFQSLMNLNHQPSTNTTRSLSMVFSSSLESQSMQLDTSNSRVNDVITLSPNDQELGIYHPPVGTCAYRRYLYDSDLWVMPHGTRERECSASFYRRNPSCTHRLVPWLNRELLAILENPYECESVIQLIMKALNQYDIPSLKFRKIIEPYTLDKTHHFLHEFYYFANSIHETMETYNRNVLYVPKSRAKILEIEKPRASLFAESSELSSSDSSDSIKILDYSSSSSSSRSKKTKPKNPRSVSQDELNRAIHAIEKIDDENNNTMNNSLVKIDIIEDFDNPTPGPSGLHLKNSSQVAPNTEDDDSDKDLDIETKNFSPQFNCSLLRDDSDSDDSVKIVGYLKPRHERTPEIIDIISEKEDDEVEVKNESKKNKSDKNFQDSYIDGDDDEEKEEESDHEAVKSKIKKHHLTDRKRSSESHEREKHSSKHLNHNQSYKEKRRKHKRKFSSTHRSERSYFKPRSFIGMTRFESSSSGSDSEPVPRKCFIPSIIVAPNSS